MTKEEDLSLTLSLINLTGEKKISIITEERFPEIDSDIMVGWFGESLFFPDNIMVYSCVRKDHDGLRYVDIYFVGTFDDGTSGYSRFVIEPGKRMNECQEEDFLWFCNNDDLMVSDSNFYLFMQEIHEEFDDIHCYNYKPEQIGDALVAIYYSTHKGIMEILYKASLTIIAKNLPRLAGVNYVGTTPSSIVGGLPLRLLRILNSSKLVKALTSEEAQRGALSVYKRYSGYFMKHQLPSFVQWKYLESVYSGKIEFCRRVFEELNEANDESIIDEYNRFIEISEFVYDYYPVDHIPDVYSIRVERENLENVLSIIRFEPYYDKELKRIAMNSEYMFEDEAYKIVFPKTLIEFTREAALQHNCLIGYLDEVIKGNTLIAFIRKKAVIEKPLITMEINHREIKQAYGCCNREVHIDELDFIDRFSISKLIEFDPFSIVEDLPYDMPEEFENYYELYLKRRGRSRNNIEDYIYEQITIADWLEVAYS